MPILGKRKQFNDRPERQTISMAAAEEYRIEERDRRRFRWSVSWLDVAGDWYELEYRIPRVGPGFLIWRGLDDKPERYHPWLAFSYPDSPKRYPLEMGAVADGESHAVWVSGLLVPGVFKWHTYQDKIHQVGGVFDAFSEVYGIYVTRQDIRSAYQRYASSRAEC